MKPGFICHKNKLWVSYTITTISKKPDTEVEPKNWIWCLKQMHHHYFVRTKLQIFTALRTNRLFRDTTFLRQMMK
jgi:hypothetical protein